MSQDVLLWVGSIAASVIGALVLIVLNGIRKDIVAVKQQSEDSNQKITAVMLENAAMKTSHMGLVARVDSLQAWRDAEQQRQIASKDQRIAELERELKSAKGDE